MPGLVGGRIQGAAGADCIPFRVSGSVNHKQHSVIGNSGFVL